MMRYRIGQEIRRLLRLAPAVHAELAERVGVGVTDLLALDDATSAPSALGVVELAELLKIRSASATVLVDRLVESGHLERRPHSGDRRRVGLHPTAAAHHDVRAALDPLICGITDITSGLNASQTAVVLQFLTQLIDVLENFAETRPETQTRPDKTRRSHTHGQTPEL